MQSDNEMRQNALSTNQTTDTWKRALSVAIVLAISVLVLLIFWKLLQALLRQKTIQHTLQKLPRDQLDTIFEPALAQQIASDGDDMYINALITGLTGVLGIGSLLGFIDALSGATSLFFAL